MTLTKEQAIENHRKMWNWIADETLKRKRVVRKDEYFIEKGISVVQCWCYCCEYSTDNSYIDCDKCPIQWKNGLCEAGEYDDWRAACFKENYKKAAKLARIIANLPESKYIADGGK